LRSREAGFDIRDHKSSDIFSLGTTALWVFGKQYGDKALRNKALGQQLADEFGGDQPTVRDFFVLVQRMIAPELRDRPNIVYIRDALSRLV
jgi:hypothetical protein